MKLACQGLVKRYGGRKVVDEVSLELDRGEIVGLLGPNGAGKTTTFHMITGFIRPEAGVITLDGQDITKLPVYRRARLGLGGGGGGLPGAPGTVSSPASLQTVRSTRGWSSGFDRMPPIRSRPISSPSCSSRSGGRSSAGGSSASGWRFPERQGGW